MSNIQIILGGITTIVGIMLLARFNRWQQHRSIEKFYAACSAQKARAQSIVSFALHHFDEIDTDGKGILTKVSLTAALSNEDLAAHEADLRYLLAHLGPYPIFGHMRLSFAGPLVWALTPIGHVVEKIEKERIFVGGSCTAPIITTYSEWVEIFGIDRHDLETYQDRIVPAQSV